MALQNEHRQRITRQLQTGEAAFAGREDQPIKSAAGLSGNLLLMAALIGVSRAVFGSVKPTVQHAAVSDQSQVARGRTAEAPSEIPAKGWMDIAWRVLEDFQSDRVMLMLRVTFYALFSRRRLYPSTGSSPWRSRLSVSRTGQRPLC